jgi:hypothetical protein
MYLTKTEPIRLLPTDDSQLLAFMERFNLACNYLLNVALAEKLWHLLPLEQRPVPGLPTEVLASFRCLPGADPQGSRQLQEQASLQCCGLLSAAQGDSHHGYNEERRRTDSHRGRNLQRKCTHSARRKLLSLGGRQSRYQRDVNRRISKAIVQKAQQLSCGVWS